MAARKRGSSKHPHLLRRAALWGMAALGTLTVLSFVGYAQLLSYLQGERFRDALERTLTARGLATDADISGTLGIDANRISLQGFTLTREGLLHAVEGRRIHAELRRAALWDKELHLTRLMVEEASVSLRADVTSMAASQLQPGLEAAKEASRRALHKAGGANEPEPATAHPKKPSSFLSRLAPTRARLDKLDCKDFNARLQLGDNEYRLTDSALSAAPAPRQGKGAWELSLSNGRIHTALPVLGDCSLKAATLTLGSKATTLSDARLMLSPGEVIINAAHEKARGDWSADIRANNADMARLISEDWKKRVSGVLYGRLQADGNTGGLQQAQGSLSLQQGRLEALPFLENLPVDNSYPYRSLRLEKATARLSYPHADAARNIHKAWLLDEIDLRSEGGWLRLQGHVLVDEDGALGGTLLIGLPTRIATQLAPPGTPLHLNLFNGGEKEGFLWLRLNLSGSLSAPQEDLSVRLMTLMSSAADTLRGLLLPRKDTPATPHPADSKEPEETPANLPGQLLQGAGEAAESLIGSGLRSLF